MINKDHQKIFKEVLQNDKNNLTLAIQAIRDNGGSALDCVKILKKELRLSLSDADEILWKSKVWADIEEQTFKLRDDFGKALEDFDEDI